jgi:hypothetical protein
MNTDCIQLSYNNNTQGCVETISLPTALQDCIAYKRTYWAPFANKEEEEKHRKPFDPKIIEHIYTNEIVKTDFNSERIMLLEVSHYLEKYP